MDFADAIKRGSAEGEVVATSKLFEKVKAHAPWAVCFFLKNCCGWRECAAALLALSIGIEMLGRFSK
jgi:hypothetical protein